MMEHPTPVEVAYDGAPLSRLGAQEPMHVGPQTTVPDTEDTSPPSRQPTAQELEEHEVYDTAFM